MTDRERLIWLHQHLVKVHGESPLKGYMHGLRDMIYETPPDRDTVGNVCTMRSNKVQDEIAELERRNLI